MKAFRVIKNFFWLIFFSFILFIVFSCSQSQTHETKEFVKTDTIIPPVVVKAGPPIIVQLDTCPPPYYVVIPVKDSVDHVYNTSQEPFHVKLGPPTVKPADFFITMSNYNADKGLAINSIMSSYCDKKGILWFGTNGGGLTRYDGNSSETFTSFQGLGSNQVRSITEDKKGNIWFVMGGGGVAKYDGVKFTNFTTEDGLANNEVRSVTIDKEGQLWFGTFGGGVSCFNGKSFTNYTTLNGLINNKIFCSLLDKQGKLWFGSIEGGISSFDGKSFTNYTTAQGLIHNSVRCIIEDKKGNLWFGTGGGISKFDGKIFSSFTTKEGLSSNNIFSITEDRFGNLWFGTVGGGVSCFDGKSFFNIGVKQGLPYETVRSIAKDRSGNIWFGTFSEGASCYSGSSVISFTSNQGLPNNKIWSVFEDSNSNLWFGTEDNGVCRYDGKFFIFYGFNQGLYGRNANCIFEDKSKNIWFGTNGGISRFDGRSFTSYTTKHGLAGMQIRHIIQDRFDNLWFASELGGISRFDGKTFATFTTVQGLPGDDIRVILENAKGGGLWIGTHGGGISYYNGNSFANFNNHQGLTNNFVFTLIKDSKGNIWIGTGNGGISILHKEIVEKIESGISIKQGDTLFENFTTNEGLSDNAAYDVGEDKSGNILIGTNQGITMIKNGLPPFQKRINKSQIEYYNIKTGYPILDDNAESMYVDSKGHVWMGTGQKLIKFDYSSVTKSLDPPLVHLKQLKVNNESITWNNLLLNRSTSKDSLSRTNLFQSFLVEEAIVFGSIQSQRLRDSLQKKFADIEFDGITPYYPLPISLKLPHKHNSVTFIFAAIEPARPAQVHYQYMLKNYDKDWSPVITQTSATFGNIHEGNYTFMVKAESPDGIWSEPVEYSFVVLPPIWRTWWAIAFYVLTAGAFLSFGIRYRIASVRKKEQERAKHEKELLEMEARALRAQMNPHFIFNCLNSIKALIQEDEKQKATDYLTTFSKLIRTLFQNSDKRQISLFDEVETCRLYTQLEAMRLKGKLNYNFIIDPNVDLKSVMVPALIIQPFIENAIWHGIVPKDEGTINVSIKQNENAIVCEVDDDGIGRELSKLNKPVTPVIHESKGVHLSQARIDLEKKLNDTNASIETIDRYDNGHPAGTKVIITFNIQ